MQQTGVPPQSQKPLDPSGYFSPVWHRFFLKMYAQMGKTNNIETTVNFSSSSSQDGIGSNSELSKKIEELETRLIFSGSQESYLKRIEELETQMLFNAAAKDLSKRIEELEITMLFAVKSAIAKLVEDGYPQLGGNLDTNSKTINKISQINTIENESKLLQTEDIFSDFVVTGLLPATSANLTSDISAGRAYTTGVRNYKAAFSKTYTANNDTWVDIDSTGAYTFVEDNNTLLVEDCEDVWNESVDADATVTAEGTIKKVGTNSVKIAVAAGATAGDILATEAITSLDISGATHIRFWIRSSVATAAGDLQLLLDETASCASPSETLNVPALAVDTWEEVTVALSAAAADLDAIISVGLKYTVDIGACNIYIDDIHALVATTVPAITADSQRLAKVVTDSLQILSVTDLRQISILSVDKVRARDAKGLLLQDDGGNGIFINDGGIVDMAKQSSCGVMLSSNQTITTSTWTKLAMATEEYDIQNDFDSATNYRFTAPKAGIYDCKAGGKIDGLGDAKIIVVAFRKNGVLFGTQGINSRGVAGNDQIYVSCNMQLAANDYVETWIWHNHGSDLTAQATDYSNKMQIHKLS